MSEPSSAAPLAVGDLAFAYNMSNFPEGPARGLYTFVLDNFTDRTWIGNPGGQIYALDFDPTGTILYALPNNVRKLGTIDTATGQFTLINPGNNMPNGVPGNGVITGLTIHPITGAAYFSVDVSSNANSVLYSIDLTTGVASVIGDMGVRAMIDIAMNCAGELYGHSTSFNRLYRIDPATAATTLIGTHGISSSFAQGMDFDNSSGKLYAVPNLTTGNLTSAFGTFDLDTAAFHPLSTNTRSAWELAFPTSCDKIFANGFEDLW